MSMIANFLQSVVVKTFSRPYLSNGRACDVVVCPSICHGCIVAKRCETERRLLLITNKKSYIGFQVT